MRREALQKLMVQLEQGRSDIELDLAVAHERGETIVTREKRLLHHIAGLERLARELDKKVSTWKSATVVVAFLFVAYALGYLTTSLNLLEQERLVLITFLLDFRT